MTIYTVGHGARSAPQLVSILKEAHIQTLVDVRAYPGSRRHPQFSRDVLAQSLHEAGIAYDWQGTALGGFRNVPYTEHMRTAAFRDAAAALALSPGRVCVMFAEARSAGMREHALHPQEDLWPDV